MKKTGVARRLDNLGRIVIPSEIRRLFEINPDDYISFSVSENQIILEKVQQYCTFCGNDTGLYEINGKYVCADCVYKIRGIANV